MEERRYSCTDSYPQHYVQVSGQLHPWGKTPNAHLVGCLVGPKASVDIAAVLGIELWTAIHSLVAVVVRYPGHHICGGLC
jgi:hypothetical protein